MNLGECIKEEKTDTSNQDTVFTCPICKTRYYLSHYPTGRRWRKTIAYHLMKSHAVFVEGLGFSEVELKEEVARRSKPAGSCQ